MLVLYFRRQFQLSAKLRGDRDPEADSDDDDDTEMVDAPPACVQCMPVSELGQLLHELQWMHVAEGPITQMLYHQVRVCVACVRVSVRVHV